jgi:hypothetical protein
MSRCIFNVLKQILNEIPDDTDAKPFYVAVNKFSDNLVYIPPELVFDPIHFIRFSELLKSHFGETMPTEGWRKNVCDIWMNKTH